MTPPDNLDWNRWIEYQRLGDADETDIDRPSITVAQADAEEEAICAPGVDALVKKHERVIASLKRLTEAVYDATR